MAACASSSNWLMAGFFSAAMAFSSSGFLLGSGSDTKACAAFMRIASSGLSNCNAARAESISPRMRLLLTTPSALAGTGMSLPVAGSKPLPSRTTTTCSPAMTTASSAKACKNTAVCASACANAFCRLSMRVSVSPVTMSCTCCVVSACATERFSPYIQNNQNKAIAFIPALFAVHQKGE